MFSGGIERDHDMKWVKGYLRYKTITFQNVSSEAQVKIFFYFVEKLCSVLKTFNFFYFSSSLDLPNLWRHDDYLS